MIEVQTRRISSPILTPRYPASSAISSFVIPSSSTSARYSCANLDISFLRVCNLLLRFKYNNLQSYKAEQGTERVFVHACACAHGCLILVFVWIRNTCSVLKIVNALIVIFELSYNRRLQIHVISLCLFPRRNNFLPQFFCGCMQLRMQ